jgi:hypothetical protein
MRFRHRTLLVLAVGLVFAGLKAWFAQRETLVLRITQRDEPMINGGFVTLQITNVVRDDDGCIAAFTVPEQSIKVELPQGMWPYVRLHTKRKEEPAEDPKKALRRIIEEVYRAPSVVAGKP